MTTAHRSVEDFAQEALDAERLAEEEMREFVARACWSVVTALPLLSALAWIFAAWTTRRPRYLVTAAIYLGWPLLGAVITVVVSGTVLNHAVGAVEDVVAHLEDFDLEVVVLLSIWGVMWITSIIAAQFEWPVLRAAIWQDTSLVTTGEIVEQALPMERSYWTCLFLWATLGWIGAHRFYTGRWISGIFFAGTLGFAGAGWGADVFLLRRMLTQAAADWREFLRGAGPAPRLAPWATEENRFGLVDFLMRLSFFCVAPFVFVELCIYFRRLELLVVMVLVVVTCGLLGNIDQVLRHLHHLERMPLTRPAVTFFRELSNYYYHNRPQSFLYYLVQPYLGALFLVMSSRARREAWLYGKFFLTVLAFLALQQVQSFTVSYKYMGIWQVLQWIGFHILFTAFVTLQFLVPIVTTSFSFNLSGKQRRLKVLSLLVLSVTLPVGGLTYYFVNHLKEPTFISWMMLQSRMTAPRLQQDLGDSAALFLRHYRELVPPPVAPDCLAIHPPVSERFRQHVSQLLPDDEAKALHVVLMVDHPEEPPVSAAPNAPAVSDAAVSDAGGAEAVSSAGSQEVWLAVIQRWESGDIQETYTLFLLAPDGRFYSRWDRLPPAIEGRFHEIGFAPEMAVEHRVADRLAATDTRLYDLTYEFMQDPQVELRHPVAEGPPAFAPALTHHYRRLLHRELGLPYVRDFRCFVWSDEAVTWIGVRDGKRALMVLSSDGDLVERWDRSLLAPDSYGMEKFRTLQKLSLQKVTGNRPADADLIKDLVTQYADTFLTQLNVFPAHTSPRVAATPTAQFQGYLDGLIPAGQQQQFQVLTWQDQGQTWKAIRYGDKPLYLRSPRHQFVTYHPALPGELRQRFEQLLPRQAAVETAELGPVAPHRGSRGGSASAGELR